jgi:hypothetical protein
VVVKNKTRRRLQTSARGWDGEGTAARGRGGAGEGGELGQRFKGQESGVPLRKTRSPADRLPRPGWLAECSPPFVRGGASA